MSSWKNASKANQRTHRERHQPADRQHLGILEKKKDYKKRAASYHDKQVTLKALRKKALIKNPDEFYHHMINSKVQEGVHFEVEKPLEDEDSAVQEKLMNSQDYRYISMKRTAESNKLKRLQSELHMIDVAEKAKNKHFFFIDSKKEAANFDLATRLDTHPTLIGRKTNRPKLETLKAKVLPAINDSDALVLATEKAKRYRELTRRAERERELSVVEQKLFIKSHLLKSSKNTKNKPVKKSAGTSQSAPVYKWKYERKR
ncbi:probable U3 small nucleolar RNA-associated protein 11 [Neocloeon triangulifer]|uniref:probable U3 small nucleolar RNA-associated protein 11 n=1 Tax=Neocloeon triangulifer TaxID=2078957 RepID=UPI00286EEEEC|nr:probable U3 small nucleolar RNA-associated protein 11 [Neocloeon triangulifer]XP_059480742.1 probable U3 small nucleolar RNA-associated protein 11 [Neocloeon triangulifer]